MSFLSVFGLFQNFTFQLAAPYSLHNFARLPVISGTSIFDRRVSFVSGLDHPRKICLKYLQIIFDKYDHGVNNRRMDEMSMICDSTQHLPHISSLTSSNDQLPGYSAALALPLSSMRRLVLFSCLSLIRRHT